MRRSSAPIEQAGLRQQERTPAYRAEHGPLGMARGKPNPDIYLLAIKKLGLEPEQCIAFEDSENGARAAIAAGLKVVVVPDLKQPSDYVREHCHQVVASLEDWLI